MPTVRVHHADGLWLADVARSGAPWRVSSEEPTSALQLDTKEIVHGESTC